MLNTLHFLVYTFLLYYTILYYTPKACAKPDAIEGLIPPTVRCGCGGNWEVDLRVCSSRREVRALRGEFDRKRIKGSCAPAGYNVLHFCYNKP